jgi:hypothetical protein
MAPVWRNFLAGLGSEMMKGGQNMSRLIPKLAKGSLIALVALLSVAPSAHAQRHSVVVVRTFYGGWYGPGWYGPWWYGPGWYGPPAGQVKIATKEKGNSIYVDGGYAGLTGKLKKFWIRPGNHTIEIRDRDGRTVYQERVAVLVGRTIKIHPDRLG